MSNSFGSAGTVEITATDKNGNEITKLGKPLSVSLPVKKDSKKKARKSCVGYRKSKKDRWRCDHRSSNSNNEVSYSHVLLCLNSNLTSETER